MASGNDTVGSLAGSGVGLRESSTVNSSGAESSWGSTTMVSVGETSHRNSRRESLKKSRPLQREIKISGKCACVEMVD